MRMGIDESASKSLTFLTWAQKVQHRADAGVSFHPDLSYANASSARHGRSQRITDCEVQITWRVGHRGHTRDCLLRLPGVDPRAPALLASG